MLSLTWCSSSLTQQNVDRIVHIAHLFCELGIVEGIRVIADVQDEIVQFTQLPAVNVDSFLYKTIAGWAFCQT